MMLIYAFYVIHSHQVKKKSRSKPFYSNAFVSFSKRVV